MKSGHIGKTFGFNSFFKIRLTQKLFLVFRLSFFRSLPCLPDSSSFFTIGILNLLFPWFLKQNYKVYYFVWDLIDFSSYVLIMWRLLVERKMWFEFYKRLFIVCNRIIDMISLLVFYYLKISCMCYLFTAVLHITG